MVTVVEEMLCLYVAGILIAVAVGVAFGIFLGGGLLFIVWPQINRSVYRSMVKTATSQNGDTETATGMAIYSKQRQTQTTPTVLVKPI